MFPNDAFIYGNQSINYFPKFRGQFLLHTASHSERSRKSPLYLLLAGPSVCLDEVNEETCLHCSEGNEGADVESSCCLTGQEQKG